MNQLQHSAAPNSREIDVEYDNQPRADGYHLIRRRVAVVVGINRYPAPWSLTAATRDAAAVGRVLHEEYGFELLPHGSVLLDEQATRDTLISVLTESLASASTETQWLFYFAGHGRGFGALPPALLLGESDSHDLAALELPWLLERCRVHHPGELLLILDTCHSGSALLRAQDLSDQIEAGDESVRQIITSGSYNEAVLDDDGTGHSVFTNVLLHALTGRSSVHEPGGDLRFAPLLDHLIQAIPARIAMSSQLRSVPHHPLGGNLTGNPHMRSFTFRPIKPRIDPVVLADLKSSSADRRLAALAQLRVRPQAPHLAGELARNHLGLPDDHTRALNLELNPPELDERVRAGAAELLGTLDEVDAEADLSTALRDKPMVAIAAATALGWRKRTQALPALLRAVADTQPSVAIACARAAATIGGDEAIQSLLKIAYRRRLVVPFLGPNLPEVLTGSPERMSLAYKLCSMAGQPPHPSLATITETYNDGQRVLIRRFQRSAAMHPEFEQMLGAVQCPLWLCWSYDPRLPAAVGAFPVSTAEQFAVAPLYSSAMFCLAGRIDRLHTLTVRQSDYPRVLSRSEQELPLVSYLGERLEDAVVLFIGHNPDDPDFQLLCNHVLERLFGNVSSLAIIVDCVMSRVLRWGRHPFVTTPMSSIDVLRHLAC